MSVPDESAMTADDRGPGWIQTYSGAQFWPLDPHPEDLRLVDIAHALSNLCRYGGHCDRFYSVAEHSLLIAGWMREMGCSLAEERVALMHDATEAYIMDLVRPVKKRMPTYGEAEGRVWQTLAWRYRLLGTIPASVREADTRILLDERDALFRTHHLWPGLDDADIMPLGVAIQYLPPEEAKRRFLAEVRRLDIW